jgi:hydroxypyruvate reductase
VQRDLGQILEPGLAAADPEATVLRSLWAGGDCVFVGEEQLEAERVFVLSAAEDLLGDRLAGGLIVTKHGNEASSERLEVLFASHP